MPIFKKKNEKFFEQWTPDMAYVLGFFAADGTITVNPRGSCYLALQIADKALLEKIRGKVKSNHAIGVRKRDKNEQTLYRLQIGSKKMFTDLMDLGISERKAHSLSLPPIPRENMGSFVRGYFDGDGNVWTGYVHKKRKKRSFVIQTAFTSGSKKFLMSLKSELERSGISGGTFYSPKENGYRLYDSVRNSVLLYSLMYANLDSDLFLKRKKKVFENYFARMHAAVV